LNIYGTIKFFSLKAALQVCGVTDVEDHLMTEKSAVKELEQRIREFEKQALQLKAENQVLKRSGERYRMLLETMYDGFGIQNEDGLFSYANKRLCEMLGFSQDELMGKPVTDFLDEANQNILREQVNRRRRGELNSYELTWLNKTGGEVHTIISPNAIFDEDGGFKEGFAVVTDVTERKRAEEKLRHEKRHLEALIKHSSLAIVTLDEKHVIVSCNQYFEEMFQFKESEILGRNLDDVIAGEDSREDAKSYTKKTLKGEPIHGSGRRFRKDGTPVEVEFFGVPVIIDGEVVGAYGVYLDISEKREAEKALRESEERYRTIVDSIEEGYFEVDLTGNFVFFNDPVCRISGYSRDELMGMNNREYMSEATAKEVYKIWSRVYRTGEPSRVFVWEGIGKDGTSRQVESSTSLMRDTDGTPVGFRGIIRDVTEKKRLETQLQQAQKMESIGTLAGGIAHDFNNLLMGIQGNASLMKLDLDTAHPHYEKLKSIEQHVQSGAELTRQLLGFARGGRYEVKPANLNEIVEKTSGMFGRTKKEIKIHRKYEKDIWVVEVDGAQIEQVLLNCYVNAWQAMPGGGDFYIETENVVLDLDYARAWEISPGRYVKVLMRDTGVGMDANTRARIFDPFFTTKEMGRGTGLGLASAYGIIKGHEGIIDVQSEKGLGSIFTIYLPASDAQIVANDKLTGEIIKGEGTILFVDDEDVIIEIGEQMLNAMGYKVLVAKGGREAIRIYEKSREEIDGVILDMIMPGMGGGETYDLLKEINPGIKVLLSSGYSIDGQATEILNRGCDGFIQKPFNLKDLSQELQDILERE